MHLLLELDELGLIENKAVLLQLRLDEAHAPLRVLAPHVVLGVALGVVVQLDIEL